MGRSEESKKRRLEAARVRYHKRMQDPEFRKKESLRRATYRGTNLQEENARSRKSYAKHKDKATERRIEWARNNKERQNEISRKCYERNKEQRLKRVAEYKQRKDPSHGFTKSINEFRIGNITIDELNRRISGILARINEGFVQE